MNLRVNGKYLYEEGKPFFWLGDTAWLLFDRLNKEQALKYLQNRKKLGYNVIQATILQFLQNEKELNPQNELNSNWSNLYSKEYFEHCKEIIKIAKGLGLYVALLPCWGSYVSTNILNISNVEKYATFLADFFKNEDNIIWILGGDIRGDEYYELYHKFGTLLKEKNKEKLISFHPFGRTGSYQWFNEESWLDFNMFQSGHRRYDQVTLNSWDDKNKCDEVYGEDNYKYVIKNNSYEKNHACLDAEPSYEGIVQGLHDLAQPYWQAYDVRRYAYWSVFAGTCGFTYGHNSVFQFYKGFGPSSFGPKISWEEALNSDGAKEMQYLKKLILSVDFTKGSSHQDYLGSSKEKYHYQACFAGSNFIFVYDYLGEPIVLSLKEYKDKKMNVYWMNPKNNDFTYLTSYKGIDQIILTPIKREEESNDWVLVIKEDYEKN